MRNRQTVHSVLRDDGSKGLLRENVANKAAVILISLTQHAFGLCIQIQSGRSSVPKRPGERNSVARSDPPSKLCYVERRNATLSISAPAAFELSARSTGAVFRRDDSD